MVIEIVSFPTNRMVIFQFAMWQFTRGYAFFFAWIALETGM